MGILDDIDAYKPNTLIGTNTHFIDGDTLENPDGPNYRLRGYDAAEVSKILKTGEVKEGTAGGSNTTGIISNLANEQGFTNIRPVFNPDGSPMMDTRGGRQMVDLINDKGENFSSMLMSSGAMDTTEFSTDSDRIRKVQAQGDRERAIYQGTYKPSAFDKAAAQIENAELEAGAKSLGFKRTLANEKERASYISYFMESQGMSRRQAESEMNKYFNRDVDVFNQGVSLNNKSLNPMSDSWEQGWISVGESAFGVANMLGSATGSEGLESWGQDGVDRQNSKMQQYGYTINSYTDVDSIGSAFEYLGNNMALSLPYMAATAAATVAAPVTFGASYTLPVGLYAGQTWNDMEGDNDNKSATIAIGSGIAQAVLDRLGLRGLGGLGKNPTTVLQEAANSLAKSRGIALPEAKSIVKGEADIAIAAFAQEAQTIAKKQLTAKSSAKRVLGTVGVGSVSEGLTEVGQEAIGYLSAVAGSDKVFDMEEFEERLGNAAIAGASLGATFSVPGTVKDQITWMDAAVKYGEPATPREVEKYRDIEIEKYGTVRTITQGLDQTKAEIPKKGIVGPSISERSVKHKALESTKSFRERASNEVMNISQLWRASVTNAIPKSVLNRSASARLLASSLGGTLTPLHGGSGLEAAQHHLVTSYRNQLVDPKKFYEEMGLKSLVGLHSSKKKAAISDRVYSVLRKATDPKSGQFDANLIPEDTVNRAQIAMLGNQLIALGKVLRYDQMNAGAKMGDITNYLHRFKSISKAAVLANPDKFKSLLVSKFGITPTEALEITDKVIDNPEINSLGEAMQSNIGSLNPSSQKKRTMNLSETEGFEDFYESDIFANVTNASKSAARYTTQMQYVGKDGEIISQLLNNMKAEGLSEEEVNKVARDVQDILEAVSGNYSRPKTQAGKKAMRFQKSAMFWMTLSALPLATFSSLPELAMTQGALTKDQIFGNNGSIKTAVREFTSAFIPKLKKVEESIDDSLFDNEGRRDGRAILRDTGFFAQDVGAATVAGVSEVNDNRRTAMEAFFKVTGLTAWTDYMRAIRGAMAFDFISINTKLMNVRDEFGDKVYIRETQDAEQKLRSLGIPVEQFVDIHTRIERDGYSTISPAEKKLWDTSIKEATFNFINQAVALPGAANRPLIYQDPRFALFTQFQGFISTFTANQLPRMWNDYIARGTPTMRYNTFVMMSTMIALGFFSQSMKDLIKFDDDEDNEGTFGNPYLDKPEYIRRGVMASGLFGTGERVIDMFAPIYGQRSKGVGDWIYNQATGESPTLGYVGRIGDAGMNLVKGDVERAVYQGLKSAPLIGPLTDDNKRAASFITGGGWNYKEKD